jgi:hypothetical protein
MTKDEMKILDSILISPVILILNQYFNLFVSEFFVLWIAFVSIFNRMHSKSLMTVSI